MTKKQNKTVLTLINAIGNPIRLDILRFLSTREECVCNIFNNLNLPQNLASHHLGILRKSGLVKARKDGKWVHYSFNMESFKILKNLIDEFTSKKNIKYKFNSCTT